MIFEIIAFNPDRKKYESPYLYSARKAVNLVINLRHKNKRCRYYLKKYGGV